MTRVLFLEPMTSIVELVAIVHRLGFETVVASYDAEERRLPEKIRSCIDTLIVVDLNDSEALLSAVHEENNRSRIDAVIPGIEFYVATASRVAASLGLPGLPAEHSMKLRDKRAMHLAAVQAGIARPQQALIENNGDIINAVQAVGFPAVLKPVDSAGSIHVSRVETMADVQAAYQAMCLDQRPDDVGRQIGTTAVLERYIEGPEVSVEGYVDADGPQVLSITQKMLGKGPQFVETGHLVGRWYDPSLDHMLSEYVRHLCTVFHLSSGPFHIELRLPEGKPVLVEVGGRIPGGRITRLVELVTGVSMPLIALAAALGLPANSLGAIGSPRAKFAGVQNFVFPQLEYVKEIHGIDQLTQLDGVIEHDIYVRPGDSVEPYGDFRSRLGHAVFIANDLAEAMQRRSSISEVVHFA